MLSLGQCLGLPYLALLIYRATPLPWCNLSPSQLLMGRHLRTNLPQVQEHLQPKWTYLGEFKQQHANYKQKQKSAYDTRHRVRPLAPIPEDNEVWVTMGQTTGRINREANTPRSYVVDTPQGQIRHNHCHLHVEPENTTSEQINSEQEIPAAPESSTQQTSELHRPVSHSMTGTVIRPPGRLRH